jgi:hypothetical protein
LAALNTRLRKSVTPQESNLAALLFALGRSTSSLHCPTHCVVFALHEWTWVKSPNSTWNNVGSFVEISVGRNNGAGSNIPNDGRFVDVGDPGFAQNRESTG